MLTRTPARAIFLLGLMATLSGCRSLPWSKQKSDELNLAVSVRNNQLFIPSARVESRAGSFLVGTAAPGTLLSPEFLDREKLSPKNKVAVVFGSRRAIPSTPLVADLQGMADGILGADLWRAGSISVDYNSGLITYSSKRSFVTNDMATFGFREQPEVDIVINEKPYKAIVDTAIPDTLILPESSGVFGATATPGRTRVNVVLAGYSFPNINARTASVPAVRIGNRLLSKFLLVIDYRTRIVGLWRDPRTSAKIER